MDGRDRIATDLMRGLDIILATSQDAARTQSGFHVSRLSIEPNSTNPDQSVEDAAGEAVEHQGQQPSGTFRCARPASNCGECNARELCSEWEDCWGRLAAMTKERDELLSGRPATKHCGQTAIYWYDDAVAWQKVAVMANEKIAKQATLIEAQRTLANLLHWGHEKTEEQLAALEKVQAAERALDGTDAETKDRTEKLDDLRKELTAMTAELEAWQRRSAFNRSVALCGETWTQEAEDKAGSPPAHGQTIHRSSKGLYRDLSEALADMTEARDKIKERHLETLRTLNNACDRLTAERDAAEVKLATTTASANATIARLVAEQEAKP